VRESWDRRIQRAAQLATADGPAAPLVVFYETVLRLQKDLYEFLGSQPRWRPTGALDRDLAMVRRRVPALLRGVAAAGPEALAGEAISLLEGPEMAIDEMLLTYWRVPSDRQFFPKAVLQPYMQWLSEEGVSPAGRHTIAEQNRCPFCGGAPQLSTLRVMSDPLAHGGGRALLCATCLTSWPFRRVLCASCGEEDERKLGYFQAPAHDHLRIEACDSCRRYLKSVDLTRLGVPVPIVDEVAGAPLDLWAREHGYEKIELNLVGL
jgi:formate dehydrogenase accessory protein FdhE